MSNKVYEKIINELSFINYSGTIFFHSNNEPLLDDELEDKIKYAFLSFYTNGTLLNLEIVFKFKSAGIDKITINNYNNELILNENIQKIVNKLKVTDPKLYPKIVIILRKSDEVLNNRGGLAPNKNKNLSNEYKLFRNSPCYLPFEEIIVRADGKVSLCSNDAYGKKTLGDITKGDLRTIWSGAKFNEVREKLSTFKRYELDLCKECDK
jgi:radical SAM protein with 4Fe4S-binding SPASM domain